MIDHKFQRRLGVWVESTFGEDRAVNAHERALRFLEEALELCQVVGVTNEQARRLIEYVFDRPAGHLRQEVGGCALTLAALCNAAGEDLSDCAHAEMERVEDPEVVARCRTRQAEKDQAFGCLEIDFQARQGTFAA